MGVSPDLHVSPEIAHISFAELSSSYAGDDEGYTFAVQSQRMFISLANCCQCILFEGTHL